MVWKIFRWIQGWKCIEISLLRALIHSSSAIWCLKNICLIFKIIVGFIKVESLPGSAMMVDLCVIQMVAFIPSIKLHNNQRIDAK